VVSEPSSSHSNCNALSSDLSQVRPQTHLSMLTLQAEVLFFSTTESDKPMIHADATRLFQEQNESEDAWSTRYTPPAYTTPRSTSKISHIKARLNRQRDGTAFATVVMPAQYAVISAVLEGVKTRLGAEWAGGVDRVIEWGSGTGAGMW